MLTDKRLKELHTYQFALIVLDEPAKAADAMNELLTEYHTLQQQNKQLIEGTRDLLSIFNFQEDWCGVTDNEGKEHSLFYGDYEKAYTTKLKFQSLQGGQARDS